jgi:hypothetical protein
MSDKLKQNRRKAIEDNKDTYPSYYPRTPPSKYPSHVKVEEAKN